MAIKDTAQPRGDSADAKLSGDLKSMFDTVARQPIPEHLLELVDALEEKRRREERRSREF
jgi:hypothetical protein